MGDKPKWQRFKRYPIWFFHIDIAEAQTAEGKLYPLVGIDRTSKYAVTQLVEKANRTRTEGGLNEHLGLHKTATGPRERETSAVPKWTVINNIEFNWSAAGSWRFQSMRL